MRRFFLIFTILISAFTTNAAFADCRTNNDWPDKPCLDMPPYPKSMLVDIWDEYHSMKGEVWMEDKRTEMDYAIEKGIFQEWLSYGTQFGNHQNYNVHIYYFLNDDHVPANGNHPENLIRGEDQNHDVTLYSDSDKDLYEIIITYYYISTGGGLLVLLPLVVSSGFAGFLVWRKRK